MSLIDGNPAECVHDILCSLGDAALAPVKALLNSQLVLLNGLLAQATITLAGISVVTAPLESVLLIANGAVATIRAQFAVLPDFQGCLDLNALGLLLDDLAEGATKPIQAKIDEINQLLAEKRRIEAYITKLQNDIDSIETVISSISACGTA